MTDHTFAPLAHDARFLPLAPVASGTALALKKRTALKPQDRPSFALAFAKATAVGKAAAAGTSQPAAGTGQVAEAKAARDLEGVFLNLLWQQMWRTVPKGGQGSGSFLPGGLAGDIYRDFLTQGFAEKMADAGGIGLASLVKTGLDR
jgi:hypothetical protein